MLKQSLINLDSVAGVLGRSTSDSDAVGLRAPQNDKKQACTPTVACEGCFVALETCGGNGPLPGEIIQRACGRGLACGPVAAAVGKGTTDAIGSAAIIAEDRDMPDRSTPVSAP
ncbi:hypothetical protein [Bradyrhizobium sp. Ai1a-2]|uniref:hypothetical protein n=1 Tax=Bradyrhizobium sp. Ai1a-2 TaxID=196490 RepID=UPI001268DE07|nr:hypothetical protein [Bradyrhizobium sp. Ai1a-2]